MFPNRQRGISLGGMLKWGVLIAIFLVTGMKVIPSAIEYVKLRKGIKATAENTSPSATVPEVRNAFRKYLEVDHVDFPVEDLDITKENGKVVISFAYEKKIQLMGPVSLLIAYSASTSASGKD